MDAKKEELNHEGKRSKLRSLPLLFCLRGQRFFLPLLTTRLPPTGEKTAEKNLAEFSLSSCYTVIPREKRALQRRGKEASERRASLLFLLRFLMSLPPLLNDDCVTPTDRRESDLA